MNAVRPRGFVSGLLIGVICTLVALGDMPVIIRAVEAQVPIGSVRIMSGDHRSMALVDHAGNLLVAFGAGVGNINHITSVTHVAGAIQIGSGSGPQRATVTHLNALRIDLASIGDTAVSGGNVVDTDTSSFRVIQSRNHWIVAHISSAVHIAGAVFVRAHDLALLHVSSVTHVAVSGLGTPTQALSIRCVNTGATAFESCGGTVTSDTVNVFHQSTVRHVSSVTHIASAGLAIANQALAVRCVDTGGTTFQACGGGADPQSVVQSSTWTIQAAHLVTIAHIAQSVHIGGTIQGAQFHVQGLGLPGASHGGVLTIQGITGMNAVVVSQATASSLQMTATQTGTWTVQPGNTPNTTAWLVNVQHISSQLHINIASVGGLPVPTSQGLPIQHVASVVHIAVSGLGTPTQAISIRCVNTGATAFEACGGAGAAADAVNVFHQSTVRHVSSVQHVRMILNDNLYSVLAIHITSRYDPNTKAIVSHAGALFVTCVTAAGVAESCAGTSTPDAVNVFHQSTVAHVSSVSHVALMSVAGTALNLGSGLPIGHVTSVLHIAVSGLGTPTQALSVRCVNTGATAFADCGGGGGSGDAVNVFHQSTVRHISSVTHVTITGSSHLTGALHVAGISNVGSGAPGTGTTQMVCHSTLAIHVAASAPGYTQIIHLTSSNGGINQAQWRIYICSIMVVSAHAQGFSLLEGLGTTCQGQVRHALIGSWRPDDSVVLAANGGFSISSPFPTLATQVPGNNLCVAQTSRTSGGSISGFITYRAGP